MVLPCAPIIARALGGFQANFIVEVNGGISDSTIPNTAVKSFTDSPAIE